MTTRFRLSIKEYNKLIQKKMAKKKQKRYKYICSVCGKGIGADESFSVDENEKRIHFYCGIKN